MHECISQLLVLLSISGNRVVGLPSPATHRSVDLIVFSTHLHASGVSLWGRLGSSQYSSSLVLCSHWRKHKCRRHVQLQQPRATLCSTDSVQTDEAPMILTIPASSRRVEMET